MDHKHINDFDLVDRYLKGRLAPEETAEFEEHFVDCPRCVDQLNTTRGLIDGLHVVASEQTSALLSYELKRQSWASRLLSSRKSLTLAAAVLLLAALAGGVSVYNQVQISRVEAAQARSSSAEWERRYEEELQSAAIAEMARQDSERDLKTKIAQSQSGLKNGEKLTTGERDDHGRLKSPQINVATFLLHSTRASDRTNGSPNEIIVPRPPANFVVSVELEGEKGYKAYRMTILGERGEFIWQASGFTRDRYNSLSVLFDSAFFRAGDYSLTLEGAAADGSTSLIGTYSFRVVRNH
jgi:hypothetical protein